MLWQGGLPPPAPSPQSSLSATLPLRNPPSPQSSPPPCRASAMGDNEQAKPFFFRERCLKKLDEGLVWWSPPQQQRARRGRANRHRSAHQSCCLISRFIVQAAQNRGLYFNTSPARPTTPGSTHITQIHLKSSTQMIEPGSLVPSADLKQAWTLAAPEAVLAFDPPSATGGLCDLAMLQLWLLNILSLRILWLIMSGRHQ